MDLKQALKKAAQTYFDGEGYESINKAKEGGLKYGKKYFDDFEAEVLGNKEKDKKDED